MSDETPWKSSVLRCFDSTDCDCPTCEFVGGNRDADTMEHVIRLLDDEARARLLRSAAGYQANMRRFRAGLRADPA